jgi:hypothetical protein
MNHHIDMFYREQLVKKLVVTDVAMHEPVPWGIFHVLEVDRVACIGQFIEVDYPDLR